MPEHLSGTVRFSVESLLYYAPKIDATGEALANAVTSVQRQLLGLGDFYGGSWPDQPFRDSYPRAMYAMLIMARQVADEIQGIARGIEMMAQTYGIAEDQNTADVTRIETNEGRISSLINHTGGFTPPPSANPFASPGPPAPTIPHPQAGPAPSGADSPSPLAPGGSSSPAPHPTPSPQPGVDPTSWQPRGLHFHLDIEGPWPSGDPARMEEAASYWNTLGVALDTAWMDLQRYTAYIMADAQGAAADSFSEYVDRLTGAGHGALTRAIETAQALNETCLSHAQEVRDLRRTLEQTAIELVATFVIGQIVSVLTFESTQALSDALDAGAVAKLTELAKTAEWITRLLGSKLDDVIEAMSKAFSQMVAAGRQSLTIGFWDTLGVDVINRAFGESPGSGTALLQSTVENGVLGMFFGQGSAGGLFGLATGSASLKLIEMGEALQKASADNASAGQALIEIGLQLKSGGITMAAANSAASQLITQHEITPVTFIAGTVSNRFTTAITPGGGGHERP